MIPIPHFVLFIALLLYQRLQRLAPLHVVLFIVISGLKIAMITIPYIVLFIVLLLFPKIAMVAPLHIVLFIVIFLFLRLKWLLYHALCCPMCNYCIQDCNGCTTTYCVVHCNLSAFEIAMIPTPYLVFCLYYYCIKDCNGCTTIRCVVHCNRCCATDCND